MNKEDLIKLKQYMSNFKKNDDEERNLYLKKILSGEILGPLTGYASIDKPWLKYYTEEQIKTKMPKMSVYSYLYECNKDYFYRNALSYYGKKITFAELFNKIDETAKALKTLDVKDDSKAPICINPVGLGA